VTGGKISYLKQKAVRKSTSIVFKKTVLAMKGNMTLSCIVYIYVVVFQCTPFSLQNKGVNQGVHIIHVCKIFKKPSSKQAKLDRLNSCWGLASYTTDSCSRCDCQQDQLTDWW